MNKNDTGWVDIRASKVHPGYVQIRFGQRRRLDRTTPHAALAWAKRLITAAEVAFQRDPEQRRSKAALKAIKTQRRRRRALRKRRNDDA